VAYGTSCELRVITAERKEFTVSEENKAEAKGDVEGHVLDPGQADADVEGHVLEAAEPDVEGHMFESSEIVEGQLEA
jgi:hypothetical protein